MFTTKGGLDERKVNFSEPEESDSDEGKDHQMTIKDFLPSRTLHHKKKMSALPPTRIVNKKGTEIGVLSVEKSDIYNEIRQRLSSGPMKRSFLRQSERRFTQYGEEAMEGAHIPEEQVSIEDQFEVLRALPVPLSEKRLHRKSIIYAAATAPEPPVWKTYIAKLKNLASEVSSRMVLWSDSLKCIEGLYGTSVVSYFIFLRWILYLNVIMSIVFLALVILPQASIPSVGNENGTSKWLQEDDYINSLGLGHSLGSYTPPIMLSGESGTVSASGNTSMQHIRLRNVSDFCAAKYLQYVKNTTLLDVAAVLQNLVQGMGWMEHTLMFMGYYSPVPGPEHIDSIFNIGVAYLDVLLTLYIISICMMIKYIGKGVEENIVSEGNSHPSYSSILFSGWDYCITNPEAAGVKMCSIYFEIKENLSEAVRREQIAKWDINTKLKIYTIRATINIFTLVALTFAYYVLYMAADFQIKEMRRRGDEGFAMLLIQFLPATLFTCLNVMLPAIFNALVRFENYGYQQAINITLVRTVFIRLASIIILVISFYRQITCEPKDICGFGLKNCPSPLCWETYVGQQMYKLVIMDLIVIVGITFCWEVPRRYAVTHYNSNKIISMLGMQTFDIPTQVLGLVYSQTLCWIGSFFSPLLPMICVFKTVIIFYVKKYTVLVNCVPPRIPYRASRTNAVFIVVLMLSFVTTVAVLGFTVSSMETSPGCSPFRYYYYMTDCIEDWVKVWDTALASFMNFIFSAGFAVPAVIVLCVATYYYLTLIFAHKRLIEKLREQLLMEGQDREFLLKRLGEHNLKNKLLITSYTVA